jgi:hypothetical protein
MAALSEDRVARKEVADAATETYEVASSTTVYANSLVGVLSGTDKVEPVGAESAESDYDLIGYTEEHVDSDDEDREIDVQFGLTVELDANESLSDGDLGQSAYAYSDHEFNKTQNIDTTGDGTNDTTLAEIGVIRSTMGSATDRAMIALSDLA